MIWRPLLEGVKAKIEVVNKLEETTYYQEDYGAKNYLNEFQTLISNTNYTGTHIVVIKFRRSL